MTAASGHFNQPLPPFQLKLLTPRPPPSSLAVSRRGFASFEPFWAKVSGYATSSRQLMATSDELDGAERSFQRVEDAGQKRTEQLYEGKPWLQSVSAMQRAVAEAYSGFRGAFWGPNQACTVGCCWGSEPCCGLVVS